MQIDYVKTENIRPADWRVTHALKPDLKLLGESIYLDGWVGPLVVRVADSRIIDGFHRWLVAQANPLIVKRDNKIVPVTWADVDEIDARLMHVRLNRPRGMIVPRYLSLLVQDVLKSRKYNEKTLCSALNMRAEEFDLLASGGLFKQRKIAEHEYSKAWIPVESNGREVPTFERPPTPDG